MEVGEVKNYTILNRSCVVENINYLDLGIVWIQLENKIIPVMPEHLKSINSKNIKTWSNGNTK